MKLWDTNVLSELTRPEPHPAVKRWVATERDVAISVVTVDEMLFGLSWKPRPRIRAWIEQFFETRCEVLEVTESVARLAGELRGKLRAAGQPRTQADLWIAATARIHGLAVVTRNVKDFEGCGVEIFDPFAGNLET